MNSEKKQKKEEKIKDIGKTLIEQGDGHIKSDVQGSYTGTGDEVEIPVQDADDL